jgi:hypothetical protein
MLAPRENLERASQLVRADLRDCLVDAALPDEIQQCLNICIQDANYPDAPLDPMNGSLDPRDGRRFGGDGDSCSRRRALAHDYLATRDGLWQARFQGTLIARCDPVAVAEAIGVYSNPDAAPSMVTAWVSAASGYYGEYLLPYPAAGGRDTGGCAPPNRLAAAEPGELGWETLRRQAAMGIPSNLGYYNIPLVVPRTTGLCVRRIDFGRSGTSPRRVIPVQRRGFAPFIDRDALSAAERCILDRGRYECIDPAPTKAERAAIQAAIERANMNIPCARSSGAGGSPSLLADRDLRWREAVLGSPEVSGMFAGFNVRGFNTAPWRVSWDRFLRGLRRSWLAGEGCAGNLGIVPAEDWEFAPLSDYQLCRCVVSI